MRTLLHLKYYMLTLVLLCFILPMQAQNTVEAAPQMADGMRANGKIYVVVAVLLTVLIGLFIYLIRLDKKISGLEKEKQS